MAYEFKYKTSSTGNHVRPTWLKVLVDAEGAEQKVVLNFYNEEERNNLATEEVYTHLDNLIQYMKDICQGISSIKIDESISADGWHFNGNWSEIEWAKEESLKWWDFVYYRDEPDEEVSE